MAVFKTNDNVEIYYEVTGEGRPLFLLPGWTCTTRFWKKNVEELSGHFKVICMDMRGHGESEKAMHSHRISRYAMDVKNLLDYLEVEDVTALGWSMGASITDEICKCPPYVRIEIMRDHTNLDWRDFIPQIKLPALVCVARHSNVFDWHGSAWVGENIPGAETVFFEDSGHMLFWEEPDKFNRTVIDFINRLPV